MCYHEIKSITPSPSMLDLISAYDSGTAIISFAVKLEKCQISSIANLFILMTSREWNYLLPFPFPSSRLQSRVYRHLVSILSFDHPLPFYSVMQLIYTILSIEIQDFDLHGFLENLGQGCPTFWLTRATFEEKKLSRTSDKIL